MPFKRALTFSLVINLFFLALCLIFGNLKFGAIDDYFMAARLTGALGTDYNPHLIFVNAIYGYALLPLYHLFPAIGWYYIGEMFSVFLSFTVIGYVLLQRCGERWGAILAALFTALFASDFYLVVQFTQCASILSAAGMLLFVFGIIRSRNNQTKLQVAIPFILGIILMLWGSIMRWQAFLMGMPFFCLGLLFILRECWSAKWHVITGLTILFAGAFGMHAFDQKIYQSPTYEDFNKFQSPRVILGDKNNYNKNAVYEDAEELGLSGKDFHLLTEWIFYDTKVFAIDSLESYTKIVQQYNDKSSIHIIPHNLLKALSHSIHSPVFWIWFIFCLFIYFTNSKKTFYSWCSLILILTLIAYLITIGRVVYRVESGFWLYATILAIPQFGQFKQKLSKTITLSILCIIALINIFSYATTGTTIRNPTSGDAGTITIKDSTDYTQVFDYIDNQSDKMFMLSMNAFMRFSHHRNPPYLATPAGSFKRTVSFGYWTPYLPEVTDALNEFYITNPIKDVIKDNVIVLNEPGLAGFLQRHYYDSVAVDTLKSIGDMTFFKYRLVNSSVQQAEGK